MLVSVTRARGTRWLRTRPGRAGIGGAACLEVGAAASLDEARVPRSTLVFAI